jgi:hypothetical protein
MSEIRETLREIESLLEDEPTPADHPDPIRYVNRIINWINRMNALRWRLEGQMSKHYQNIILRM